MNESDIGKIAADETVKLPEVDSAESGDDPNTHESVGIHHGIPETDPVSIESQLSRRDRSTSYHQFNIQFVKPNIHKSRSEAGSATIVMNFEKIR